MLRHSPRWLLALAVVVVLAASTATAGSVAESQEPSHLPAGSAAQALPAASAVRGTERSHVAVLVMENKGYHQIIGNPQAPFLNRLAKRYALATHFFAVAHPSLPNYLALTAGITFGLHNDCIGCAFGGPNLLTQLDSAGFSWKVYVGGVPSSCYTEQRATAYVKPINPFAYYSRITASPSQCANLVPFEQLGQDLQRGGLSSLSWITPDLCMNTHGCSIRQGDRFLSDLVPSLLPALGPHGALFILWDEGSTNAGLGGSKGGGRIPALIVGPDVWPGARFTRPVDSYAALRALESAFGVDPLGHARSVRPDPFGTVFTQPLSIRPGA